MASSAWRAEKSGVDERIAQAALICIPALSFFSFVSTTLADVASVVLVGISLFLIFQKRISVNSALIIAAAWILYLVFAAIYATKLNLPGDHLRGIGKYSFISIGFLSSIAFNFILSRRHLKKDTLVVLFLAGLVSGGAFVFARNGAVDFLAYGWAEPMTSLGKLNRNYVGLICSLSIISISGLIYFLYSQPNVRWLWKIVIGAALALLLFCDVMLLVRTQSRTSYFATAAAAATWAIVILVIDLRDDKTILVRRWIVPLVIVAAIAGLLAAYFPLISSRFDFSFASQLSMDHLNLTSAIAKATSSNSDVERLKLISVAFDLIDRRPWLGWGPDASRLIQSFSPYPSIRDLIQFHNGYVQILVSFGIIGTTFLTILIVAGVKSALLGRTTNPETGPLSKVLFATLMALVVCILTSNFTESVLMVKAPAMICLFIAAIASSQSSTDDETLAAQVKHLTTTQSGSS